MGEDHKPYNLIYARSDKPETKKFWEALGKAAKEQGLYWGGDWTSFQGWAHVQMHPNSKLKSVMIESQAVSK
jgi:GTP-dependent phosphoenolpyruvate carboxykinase